jgi:glutathione S-transferase
MRLYTYRYSPNPLKVRFALAELELSYESVEINLFRGEQRSEKFLEHNPSGKVPVLHHGDLALRESNAILCYLGRMYGRALWPKRPALEAKAFQWLFVESCELIQPLSTLWWGEIVSPVLQRPADERELALAQEAIKKPLDIVDKHLADNPYFLGPDFTLVDCSIAVTLNLWRNTRAEDTVLFPNIASYLGRIRARKSWGEIDADLIWNLNGVRPFKTEIAPATDTSV